MPAFSSPSTKYRYTEKRNDLGDGRGGSCGLRRNAELGKAERYSVG